MRSEGTTADIVPLAGARNARPAGAVERTPPVAPEAEIAVLAAILQNNAVLERVQARGLKPEHFADARNGALFDACARLLAKGRIANAIALKDFASAEKMYGDAGFGMLRDFQSLALPFGAAADAAIEIVAAFQKREVLAILEDTAARIYAPDVETETADIIASTSSALHGLEDRMGVAAGLQSVSGFLAAALASADRAFRSEGLVGVPTGLRDLDDHIGGLHETDLIIVAGRPSMGKTALLQKITVSAAKRLKEERQPDGKMKRIDGARVALFSLEMSGDQLANRMLGDECSIPSDKIRRGTIDANDFPALTVAARKLSELPLYIEDSGHMTVAKVRAACLRLIRKHGPLHLVGIDYLQLLSADTPPGTRGGPENRTAEISAITRGLKALAKELRCPIVALSQLSRSLEAREDKRPQLADLRESGTIEQDADVVLFCYRDFYYHERAEPKRRMEESDTDFNNRYENWHRRGEEIRHRADVIVGKQRHGSLGTVGAGWFGAFTRWYDLPQPEAEGHA